MSEDDANDMQRRIDETLRKNSGNLHLANVPRTPLEELLASEMDGDEELREARDEARVDTFRRMLEFIFQAGPEPLQVLRHVFALTKAVRPELLGDMSLEDISIICADGGRATVSARIQRIYNGTLKKSGMADARAPFQKSGNFSAPQKGNTNRKKIQKRADAGLAKRLRERAKKGGCL